MPESVRTATESLPKVLAIDLSLRYGGSTSRVLSLIERSDPGKIALAALEPSSLASEMKRRGLPVRIVGRNKTDWHILPGLIRLIHRENYRILDTQNIQSKLWGSLAAEMTKAALVSTINSWYASEHGKYSLKGRVYTALELLSNRRLAGYITVSERDARALRDAGMPPDKIALIYNAVNIKSADGPGDKRWVQSTFNLPPGSLICAAVGRLVYIKGYDILIEAMHLLRTRAPELVCLIIGEGNSGHALERQIRGSELQNRVILAGHQDRDIVIKIINSVDYFVMPSRYEGTPIALLEAAALGRPILASSTGGIPELVRHGEQAHLVPPNDPSALAEGLLKLREDQNYANLLGASAKRRVLAEFNLDKFVKTTWDAYQRAWQKHQTRFGDL